LRHLVDKIDKIVRFSRIFPY